MSEPGSTIIELDETTDLSVWVKDNLVFLQVALGDDFTVVGMKADAADELILAIAAARVEISTEPP